MAICTLGFMKDEVSLFMATNTLTWEIIIKNLATHFNKVTELSKDVGVEMMLPILILGMMIRNPSVTHAKWMLLKVVAGSLSLIPKVTAAVGTAYLSETMKAKLNYKYPKSGYAHGEKMTILKAMSAVSTLGMKTTRLVEMRSIIFTPINTAIAMIERLAQKNADTLIRANPGVIKCKGRLTCKSRRSEASTLFRQCLDVYANLYAALSALCTTEETHIPFEVVVANSNAGRNLTDPVATGKRDSSPAADT